MIVLVCGGRTYRVRGRVYEILDALHYDRTITRVITGAATGADELAERWARERQIEYRGYPAKWGKLGRQAGTARNEFMLAANTLDYNYINLVVAFPGNRGTRDMVDRARGYEIPVVEVGDRDDRNDIRERVHRLFPTPAESSSNDS